jgi:lysophospholipase L1-like esterase
VFGDSITGATSTNNTDNGTAYNITGITKASSAVISESSSLSTTSGDTMYIHSTKGMTEINNRQSTASATSSTTVTVPINSTAFTTWTADGKVYRRNNAVITNLSQGPFTACNALMGQRFIFTHENNRGIGGDTTTTLNARKAISLAGNGFESTYDLVIFMAGTNDIGTTVIVPAALATLQSNVSAIKTYVTQTLNKTLVIGTVPPADDNDATQIQRRKDYNAWVRTLADSKTIIWDYWDSVNDSGTDNWKSGYSYDGVHPNPFGGHIMGARLRDALVPYYGTSSGFVLRSSNLMLNPLMTGTGGSLSGVGATNNGVATSWTVETSGTGAAGTKTLSKDANGYQQFVANYGSGLSTGERISARQDVASGSLSIGTYYTCEALIQITAGTGEWYEASLELRNNSSGFGFDYARRNTDPLAIDSIISDGGWLHLKTQPIQFLTGWTALRPRINMTHKCDVAVGTGTMKIAACQLYPSEYS